MDYGADNRRAAPLAAPHLRRQMRIARNVNLKDKELNRATHFREVNTHVRDVFSSQDNRNKRGVRKILTGVFGATRRCSAHRYIAAAKSWILPDDVMATL